MLTYAIRRLILSVPTLLFISFVIFMLLQLAPGDPMAQVPLTVPPEVKQKMREALGVGEPALVQYWKWLVQVFWIEPKVLVDYMFGTQFAWHWEPALTELNGDQIAALKEAGRFREVAGQVEILVQDQRVISWQTRSPVMDIVVQRIPQTLWVVGVAYVVAILIALPIGIYSAYRQYSVFDQAGTFVTMIGFSIPPFFTGPLLIVIFSVQLGQFQSAAATDDHAGHGACATDHSPAQPLYARLDAGQSGTGLRPHRPRQRHERKRRGPAARVAQLDDPGCDRDCPWYPKHLWRRDHHRKRVQGERHRAAPADLALCQ